MENNGGSFRSVGQASVPSPSASPYAHTVWEALERLFDGCQETTLIEGRSQLWGQDIPKAESVEEVCKQYRVEWALFENVVEERRKREEEEERRVSFFFWDWLGCLLICFFTVEDGRRGSTSTRD
jgi:hypothetical protein